MSDTVTSFDFESSALDPNAFRVVRFTGEEAISRPFRFEIELASERADIDPAAPIGQEACLVLRQEGGKGERRIQGVVSEFEQRCTALEDVQIYRVVLVPRLWQLSLGLQSRVYRGLSYPEIVESAMSATVSDSQLALSSRYPQREITVQYQENDLAFVSRLMEHEGLFYVFEPGKAGERLVVVDDNGQLPGAGKPLKLGFQAPFVEIAPEPQPQPAASEPSEGEEEENGEGSSTAEPTEPPEPPEPERRPQVGVWSFSSGCRQMPSRLMLQNGAASGTGPLGSERGLDEQGLGLVALHGEQLDSQEEADALAKVRAEELLCTRAGHGGESNSVSVGAGAVVGLSQHPNRALNRDYLVTAVNHEGWQPLADSEEAEESDGPGYVNAFAAIPADCPYRPARVTAKPKLSGIMKGRVAATGPGGPAEVDELGRYNLILPFERPGEAEVGVWAPRAQPYAGSGNGMHFPLMAGTEVIVAFADGDPDRPVIVGTLSDLQSQALLAGESGASTRIVTAGGIVMEWQDGPARGEG